jgi:nucleotide-binding universal stress UspA family protein
MFRTPNVLKEKTMIPEIKRILYTTDLSPNARYAFGYAASLANRYDAKIEILHVLEDIPHNAAVRLIDVLGEKRWEEIQSRNEQETVVEIQDRLNRFCQEQQDKLANCPFIVSDIIVKTGNAVDHILRQAAKQPYDLIVMGTHGQGMVADAMMGSTARRVVRRSQLPVLTIRLPE